LDSDVSRSKFLRRTLLVLNIIKVIIWVVIVFVSWAVCCVLISVLTACVPGYICEWLGWETAGEIITVILLIMGCCVFIMGFLFIGVDMIKDIFEDIPSTTSDYEQRIIGFSERTGKKFNQYKNMFLARWAARSKNMDSQIRFNKPDHSTEKQIAEIERGIENVGNMTGLLFGKMAPRSAWKQYKTKKDSKRAEDNLSDLANVLNTLTTAAEAAQKTEVALQNLKQTEKTAVTEDNLTELRALKGKLETVKMKAEIAGYEKKIAESEADIHKLKHPPKPPRPQKDKPKAEKQTQKEEEEALRRREILLKEEKRLRERGLEEDDIQFKLEELKREMGWI